MNFEIFVNRVNAGSLKLLVGSTAALAILVGMAGDLAAWPESIIPLVLPLVWFFFAAVAAAAAIGAATLLDFIPSPGVRGKPYWRNLLRVLLVLSALCFVAAILHVPQAFSDMTVRLPYERTGS